MPEETNNFKQPDVSREVIKSRKSSWRKFKTAIKGGESDFNFRLGISSTMTADPIVPLLGSEFLLHNIRPEITVGPFNQIFQACLDWKNFFSQSCLGCRLDAIILLWRIDDILGDEMLNFIHGDKESITMALNKVDDLASALSRLRSDFTGSIIINTPPFPQNLTISINDLDISCSGEKFHLVLFQHWLDRVQEIGGVVNFNLDTLQRNFGLVTSGDSRKWYLYHQPYKEEFWLAIAQDLMRIFNALQGNRKKCLVVDCDNTLWGGIIGEDGLEGIQLGNDFPGSAYRDFQKQLVSLYKRGVLIAINSKNNEADVWDVFENHDAMILKKEHITTWRINWNLKSKNIIEITEDLNIGTDSLVFIDDNPVEIQEMKLRRPEVVCLQVPEDPAFLPDLIKKCQLFDQLEITSEDKSRTEMIRTNLTRKRIEETMSEEDFLQTLGLNAKVFSAGPEHINRVTQLINKTNQFNLTTIRRSQDEVESLMKSDNYMIFALKASDRFGDYGLIGVCIMKKTDSKTWEIDTFLISCRVLGRALETAFLSQVTQKIKNLEGQFITGRFIPTTKNAPVAEFLPKHGFQQEGDYWLASLSNISKCPAHILIK